MLRTIGYLMAAYVGVNIYAALLPHSPATGAFLLAGMLLSVRPIADLLSRSMREGTVIDHEAG